MTRHPRALADINFNSSQDDHTDSREDARTAQSVIGVSINHEQSRLADPKTPAIKKAAAIAEEGGYFNQLWTHQEDNLQADEPAEGVSLTEPHATQLELQQQLPRTNNNATQARSPPALQHPSPWRAGTPQEKSSDTDRSAPREGLHNQVQRHRSSSGPESLRMRLPFNLPGLSKSPSVRKSKQNSSESQELVPQQDGLSESCPFSRRPTNGFDPTGSGTSSSSTLILMRSNQNPTAPEGSIYSHPNRTSSDDSLYFQRALSTASSLGDDSRFEDVQEMVNSRLKALKDSFQDTNFKLPFVSSLPRVASLRFNSSQSSLDSRFSGRDTSRSHLNTDRSSASHLFTSPNNASRDLREAPVKPRGAAARMTATNATAHPNFLRALDRLTGDLVILGGYRGSVLRSVDPTNRRLWIPLKASLNLRRVNLEVGLEDEDEATMSERVVPDGMLTHIGPVDISRHLFQRFRASDNAANGKLRVHNYGYDWRLSPHRLSTELIQFLERLPSNQPGIGKSERGVTVIAHSLGGLITRHAINQRPDLFAGVVYAGVPQHCVNILGPLRNGDEVLFSSRVLTAQVNFTVRTSFTLLPTSGRCFFNKETKEEYPVDFFDINDWIEYRWSPCIDPPLPAFTPPTISFSNIIERALPSKALTDLPFANRRGSLSRRDRASSTNSTIADTKVIYSSANQTFKSEAHAEGTALPGTGIGVQMGGRKSTDSEHGAVQQNNNSRSRKPPTSSSTTVTLDRSAAIEYLTRTLQEILLFKSQLALKPAHACSNAYPPLAVLYGKSEPTVYGAKVSSREAIKHADAYDNLAFASGDGVVLARAAMLPEGYKAVKGGVVATNRGHVSLLGDLEAVGKCLVAVMRARERGVGLGSAESGSGQTSAPVDTGNGS